MNVQYGSVTFAGAPSGCELATRFEPATILGVTIRNVALAAVLSTLVIGSSIHTNAPKIKEAPVRTQLFGAGSQGEGVIQEPEAEEAFTYSELARAFEVEFSPVPDSSEPDVDFSFT